MAVLTKWSNMPILGVMLVFCIFRFFLLRRTEPGISEKIGIAAMLLSSALPLFFWCLRNYAVFVDFTGASERMRQLTWTVLPFRTQLKHPIFSVTGLNLFTHQSGLSLFLFETIASFWRGEFVWYTERIRSHASDLFFYASSLFFPVVSLWAAMKRGTSQERSKVITAFLFSLVMLAQLLVLSVMFDFGLSYYPRPDYPYMTSGRLILGALIPFMILYVDGFSLLLRPFRKKAHPLMILLGIMVIINILDFRESMPLFRAAGTWFNP
jgi:hypothetical protein